MGRDWKRLVCIVNGVDVEVMAARWSTFAFVIESAVADDVQGMPLHRFVVRDALGVTMPTNVAIGRFNLPDGATFFLMPAIGVGGNMEASIDV